MFCMANTEQQGAGIENGLESGEMELSAILIRPVHRRKVVHLERWTDFFETFPMCLPFSCSHPSAWYMKWHSHKVNLFEILIKASLR